MEAQGTSSVAGPRLIKVVADQLSHLSERALELERAVFARSLGAGLLVALAVPLFLLDPNGYWIAPASAAVVALLSAGEMAAMKKRTIDDIDQFEERLSRANFGIDWTPTCSLKVNRKLRPRIYWRRMG